LRNFIKFEKLNLYKKPDCVPRLISPRAPEFNIEVGRFIKPAEGVFYQAINTALGYKAIAKGMNCIQSAACLRANWLEFKQPICIPLDVTRFDQHVSEPALKFEHSFYNAIFNSAELRSLLKRQLRNVNIGRAPDGIVKYTTDGKRSSGDMNTALGNVILMVSVVQAYCAKIQVKSRLFDNGDDCCVIIEKHNIDKFTSGVRDWFLHFGFTLDVSPPVSVFEQIEFCQCSPVWDGECYRMVRNPKVAFQKDAISIHPRGSVRDLKGWLGATGEGGMALTTGIPCCQAYYQIYINSSDGKRAKLTDWEISEGKHALRKGLISKFRKVTPYSRYSFWLAFGITPDEQTSMENLFNSIPKWQPVGRALKLLKVVRWVIQPFSLLGD